MLCYGKPRDKGISFPIISYVMRGIHLSIVANYFKANSLLAFLHSDCPVRIVKEINNSIYGLQIPN